MAYRAAKGYGVPRDQIYPSEVAAQRPALATRVDCDEDSQMEANEVSILGDRGEIDEETGERHFESRSAEFHRRLRSG